MRLKTTNQQVTAARQKILLGIVERKPGATIDTILAEAMKVYHRGRWPDGTWSNAKKEPYRGGVYQMLQSMVLRDLVVSIQSPTPGVTTMHYYLATQVPAVAEEMLPDEAERAVLVPLAEGFARRTGMTVNFAVTDKLERVVQVVTARGVVERAVSHYANWKYTLSALIEECGGEVA